MPLDPNSLCPCGTGKKIKFCCPDLLGELQKIDRMLQGRQHMAGLQQIDRLLSEHPGRACLLAIKTNLLRAVGKLDDARQTLAAFVGQHPDNPTAMAESAILTAVEQSGPAAMAILQRALATSDGEISGRVYEAMSIVADVLLHEGEWLAGRGLLQLQMAIAEDDERPLALLVELNRSAAVPLLMKDDPPLATCGEGAPEKARFEEAMAPTRKGQWQAAAEKLTALAGEVCDSPAIWRNLATLRGWLADRCGHIEALQKLAALDVPLEEAVEAEALAMLCGDDPFGDLQEVVSLLFSIKDPEQVQAAFGLDSRALQIPFDPSSFGSTDDPPPRAAYLLLDRPIPETAEQLTLDSVSRVLGQVMIYGRQTDRGARLEVMGVLSRDLGPLRTVLGEMGGEPLEAEVEQEVLAHVSASQELLQRKWRPPNGATPEQLEALGEEHLRDALLNQWPQRKLGIFGGKSAREVARDPACRVKLLAAAMVLQLWTENISRRFDFNELRRKLGLPVLEPIDPQQSPLDGLPLVRLSRVIVEKLSDEDLLVGYRRAVAFRATEALRKFASALVERPAFAGMEEQFQALGLLAQMEEDSQRALQYVEQGRAAARPAGRSCAPWDLMELPLRFARREGDEVSRLINHLRNQHLREPGVAEGLRQFLVQVGAIRPDGTPAGARPPQAPSPAATEESAAGRGEIWTPGSESPGGEKKLWLPD